LLVHPRAHARAEGARAFVREVAAMNLKLIDSRRTALARVPQGVPHTDVFLGGVELAASLAT